MDGIRSSESECMDDTGNNESDGSERPPVDMNEVVTNRRPEKRFRHLFELIQDPVVEFELVDRVPLVRTVNPAFEDVFGYERSAILGKSLNELIVPETCQEEATRFDQRTADNKHNSGVVTRVTSTGPREFLYRGVPYEQDGRQYGFAIYSDITEQKERKRELQRQKDRLEKFASTLSHDIRNPLTVAQGRVELIEDEQATVIERNLERIEEITDDLLTLARTGKNVQATESVSLSKVGVESWAHIETGEATLSTKDDVTFQCDPGRVRQILENLFQNCIDHSDGTVNVWLGSIPGGFYVADDGPGIPPDERDDVFKRGYTTAGDGTGLGLAIVQEAVQAHGWDITVKESLAGGTHFEITGVEGL